MTTSNPLRTRWHSGMVGLRSSPGAASLTFERSDMSDRETRRLPLLRGAVAGFFSGVTRAITGWMISNVLDR
ncbi:hypothetical protein GCM10010376_93400 [Streptomyces violaceusniger]